MADYPRERRASELIEERSLAKDLFAFAAGGIGAIALGSTVFKRYSGKPPGNAIADLLHYLGHPFGAGLSDSIDKLATVGKASPKSGTGLRNLLQGTFKADGRLQLGPIDLIEDLKESLYMLGSTKHGQVTSQLKTRIVEQIHREHSSNVFSSFYGSNYQRLTAGEIFKNQKTWSSLLSEDQFGTIVKAKKEGLLTNTTVIDRNILLHKKTRQIRDVRIRSVFSGQSLFSKTLGGLDLFNQSGVIKSLIGAPANIAVLNPNAQTTSSKLINGKKSYSRGPRFFIGGNIYAYDKTGKEHLLATNQKLRYADDPLAAVTLTRQGEIGPSVRKVSRYYKDLPYDIPFGLRKALTKAELSTGVGFSFATRHPIIAKVIHPFLRNRALNKGTAILYKKPFRKEHETSKALDAFIGADLPEAIVRQGRAVEIEGGGVVDDIRKHGFWKRLKILTNLDDEYVVLNKERYNESLKAKIPLSNKDLYIPLPETGLRRPKGLPSSFIGVPGYTHEIVTEAGNKIVTAKSPYYNTEKSIVPGLTNLSDFANYLFYRVNSLASDSLLGIGFAPGKNPLISAARLAAIPLMYEIGSKYAQYASFTSEEITGFNPLKALGDVYAGVRLGLQEIRQSIGIQQLAAEGEEQFPGIFSSEGSVLARSFIPGLVGLGLSSKGIKGSFGVSTGLSILLGGSDIEKPVEEIERELSGDKKVPVRAGAWWSLGYDPLFGGRVKYFDTHWYHKLQTGSDKISKYGSQDEYYSNHFSAYGVPLPGIHNLFGLKNIANPYRWEEQNYYNRPYMQTGREIENLPIFGPAVSTLLGSLLKPNRYRQLSDLPLLKAGLVDRGLDTEMAQMLGIPSAAASDIPLQDTKSPIHQLRKLGDVALEPAGVYKFALEYFGVNLGPTDLPKIATSEVALSPGRTLYGMNLGGAFGQTEFLRRFMLSEYSSTYRINQLYNPIPNTMPSWLPGYRAGNEKDASYFIDFHRGDPYTKIDHGDTRLPGPGYEAENKLHSGKAGVYDMVDQMLILADVAPYSQQFKMLQSRVGRMNLGDEWNLKVQEAIQNADTVRGIDNRYPRYLDQLADINNAIKDNAAYKEMREAYDFITHDVLSEIPILGAKLFPFRNAYEDYRKKFVLGAEYADWNRPYETILRPMYYDSATVDPLTAAMKGAVLGVAAMGPMKMFVPISSLTKSSAPYIGAGISAAIPMYEQYLLGNTPDMVPEHAVKRSEAIEYMDYFKYAKARTLSLTAESKGLEDLAKGYNLQATRTMVGAKHPLTLSSTLPTTMERRYFRYFAEEGLGSYGTPGGLPPFMQRSLQKAWSREYSSLNSADLETAEYFRNNPLPYNEYVGYNPMVPGDAIELQMIQHGINGVSDNIHNYGFFENHESELRLRFPDLHAQELNFVKSPDYSTPLELFQRIANGAGYTYSANQISSPYYNNMEITITKDNKGKTSSLMRDYSRAL